jgi:hypothetical protein
MDDHNALTRRALINSAAAAGAAGIVGGIATAQAQAPAGVPASPGAGELLIRDAHVLSMDPAIGDLPVLVVVNEVCSFLDEASRTKLDLNSSMVSVQGLGHPARQAY